jgi:hypothetical protein
MLAVRDLVSIQRSIAFPRQQAAQKLSPLNDAFMSTYRTDIVHIASPVFLRCLVLRCPCEVRVVTITCQGMTSAPHRTLAQHRNATTRMAEVVSACPARCCCSCSWFRVQLNQNDNMQGAMVVDRPQQAFRQRHVCRWIRHRYRSTGERDGHDVVAGGHASTSCTGNPQRGSPEHPISSSR